MGMMSTFLGEKMVPSKRRARLFRTWGAGIGMLPVGGQAIWGNKTWAPDDTDEMQAKNLTFGYKSPSKKPLKIAPLHLEPPKELQARVLFLSGDFTLASGHISEKASRWLDMS